MIPVTVLDSSGGHYSHDKRCPYRHLSFRPLRLGDRSILVANIFYVVNGEPDLYTRCEIMVDGGLHVGHVGELGDIKCNLHNIGLIRPVLFRRQRTGIGPLFRPITR